ncbi:hypothetical protein OX283_009450 [Flavobacterium sp. SUN052]|uniref:hypothetical protein n=1 Tax=Flavobacterium sp. SUN052 TaxID=3002441 RepID=UPI00237E6976|nr:hypothetical protein [Flavobacterium sp. SUN052]MEC4004879.1 hypothetical protein [Flavobacterium sp. SUN052]
MIDFKKIFNLFGKTKTQEAEKKPQESETKKESDKLVDEKENTALSYIIFIAILGLTGIVMYVYQDYVCAKINHKISYAYSMCATLFFIAGGTFTLGSSIGFLFGIPRSASTTDSNRSATESHYIGNDNLLQISDWLTKIIIGVGLTQLYQIPHTLKHLANYISDTTKVCNEALLMFVIIYFGCIGFLFGYLWTRLYFIKMLNDSDNDINNDDQKKIIEVKPIDINPIEVKPIEVKTLDEKPISNSVVNDSPESDNLTEEKGNDEKKE